MTQATISIYLICYNAIESFLFLSSEGRVMEIFLTFFPSDFGFKRSKNTNSFCKQNMQFTTYNWLNVTTNATSTE